MSRSTRVLTGSLVRLNRSIKSVDLWASTDSSMVSSINFRRMSSIKTWLIVSSRFSFRQLLPDVVQNTSYFAGRLESSARAFTSSSKLIPCEESSDNTRSKVLIWIQVGYDTLSMMMDALVVGRFEESR